MADNDKIKLGKQVLSQDDLKIITQYKGETFTMRYPNPLQKSLIDAEIARRLNGMPRESFSQDSLSMIEAATYVDNMLVHEESPGWFVSAWSCYDEVLIATLYAEYLAFRDRFRTKLTAGGFAGSSEGSRA